MKTKILTIVGFVLAILGAITGVLTGLGPNIVGLAAVLFGAGAAIIGIWKNRDPNKPKWATILAIALVSVGSIIAGITGFMDEEKFTTLIGAIISIVLTIISALTHKHFMLKKETK